MSIFTTSLSRQLTYGSNCLIILSTSVGQTSIPVGAGDAKEREHFQVEIHEHFPEEFLARFDHITIFVRLSMPKQL